MHEPNCRISAQERTSIGSLCDHEKTDEMKELKDRILAEGNNLGEGILNVDSFLNHQVDCLLMVRIG